MKINNNQKDCLKKIKKRKIGPSYYKEEYSMLEENQENNKTMNYRNCGEKF